MSSPKSSKAQGLAFLRIKIHNFFRVSISPDSLLQSAELSPSLRFSANRNQQYHCFRSLTHPRTNLIITLQIKGMAISLANKIKSSFWIFGEFFLLFLNLLTLFQKEMFVWFVNFGTMQIQCNRTDHLSLNPSLSSLYTLFRQRLQSSQLLQQQIAFSLDYDVQFILFITRSENTLILGSKEML